MIHYTADNGVKWRLEIYFNAYKLAVLCLKISESSNSLIFFPPLVTVDKVDE